MNIVFITTSRHGDAWSEDWQPDVRYTVAFLRRHGLNVDFVYSPVLNDPASITKRVSGEPHVVFLDLDEDNCDTVLRFIALLRREWRKTYFVAGGVAATLSPAELLTACQELDLIVVGEREQALLAMFQRLQNGDDISRVPGLWSREFQNPPSPVMHDLECLGNMADDGIREMVRGLPPEERSGCIIGSRGCYLNCAFCSVAAYNERVPGCKWRGRTPGTIVDEMEALIQKFEIQHFVFKDQCFFGPGAAGQERAKELAREILRRRLDVRYFMCCTLHDIRRDTIELLIKSGLGKIGLAVESLNQASHTLLGKGIRIKDIYPTLELIETLRLPCEVNLIFLEPYMDFAAVRANLAFFDYLRHKTWITYSDAFPFNELKPHSWSRVSRVLQRDGLLEESDYTCRFADAGVDRLARFVARLRDQVRPIYKRTVPFFSDTKWAVYRPARPVLSSYGRGLREWINVAVLPPIISRACDILEEGGPSADAALLTLEESLRERMRTLEQRLENGLVSAAAALPHPEASLRSQQV